MARPQAEKLVQLAGITQMTAKSHVTEATLWPDLAQVQQNYFAFDDEEHSPGLRCVGSPLFDSQSNVIGALSISGPTVRLSQSSMTQVGKSVSRIARELTNALGGTWPAG